MRLLGVERWMPHRPGKRLLPHGYEGTKTKNIARRRRPIPVAGVRGLRIVVASSDRAAAVA